MKPEHSGRFNSDCYRIVRIVGDVDAFDRFDLVETLDVRR